MSSSEPVTLICPTCGKRHLRDETSVPPFCSPRCQLADLGQWLDEDIRVPFEGDPGETPVEYIDSDNDDSERPE